MKTVWLMIVTALLAAGLASAPMALTRSTASDRAEAQSLRTRVSTLERSVQVLSVRTRRTEAVANSASRDAFAVSYPVERLLRCITGVVPMTRYAWTPGITAYDQTAAGSMTQYWLVAFSQECVSGTGLLGVRVLPAMPPEQH